MPCRDYYEPAYNYSARQDANKATCAACEMRTLLRRLGFEHELSDETRNWIAEHDKEDAERIAREQAANKKKRLKKSALNKLTPAEKQALGI